MKRLGTLLLAAALVTSALTGCVGNAATASDPVSSIATASTPATKTDAKVKVGLGIVTTVASSTEAGEKDGAAKGNSFIAAVMLDQDEKIIACNLDVLQSTINFSKEGKVLTDLSTEFKTKQELKDDYGMKKASSIGKEWYEQANSFSAYVIGKTLAEIKGIAVNETGVATGAELNASVTIKLPDYIAAIEKAVQNAVETSATVEDQLGFAVVNNIKKSKDAGEAAGVAQTYTIYSAVTVGADEKITSCVIDSSQATVNFDTNGKITNDISVDVKTKNELKNDYGMQKVSKIGKEWYEQAGAYAEYVVGKTSAEVSGIAVDEGGKATDAELLAGVTVSVGDFNAVVAKAISNAK